MYLQKKKSSLLLILILILTVTISCDKNSYHNVVSKKLNSQFKDSLKKYEMVVILPGSGCTGCITNAENFFIKNVSNDKIKFILTYYSSRKSLGLKLGKENIHSSNVFIDDENFFYLESFEERIYPMVIILNNGQAVKTTNLDLVI